MINKVDTEGKSTVEFETLKIYFKEQESKREEVFKQNEDNKYMYKFSILNKYENLVDMIGSKDRK